MAAEEHAVKVCVRVRPPIHREQGDQVTFHWKAENSTISQVDGTRSFHFDRVFNSHETTDQVYQEVAVPIIRSALHGYNGTIFAYGQTSSGKTYTMMGTPNSLGIIPQAVQEVFRIIQEIPNREFLLRVSYMEIYNETVTDLLCDGRKKKPLEIREDFNRNVYVADLTEELVTVPEHVMQWIKKGEKNRHYGETKMNEHSSRSHTIFRMIVESRERSDPSNSENCDGAVMVSHLNLVDLAGSERASQTGAEGVRFKEGCNINRSLLILGQVIKKLSDGQPGLFINYRDSKLTRILQNSLGGNTKTVIICTITPVSFDETLSTLQFASAAKNVKNKPHVNEVLDDEALLKRYRKEILDLKKQLENLEASSESKAHAMAKEEHAQLLAEIQQLQKEREDRIWNLTNIVVAATEVAKEDQRVKRKRRVTWAPGKLQSSLYSAGVSPIDAGSILGMSSKKPKLSALAPLFEIDDSVCTEFSDIDEATRAFEDLEQDWNLGSKVTRREKSALHHSMIEFDPESHFNGSTLSKASASQKFDDLGQKLAELENRLKSVTKDYETEVEKRQSSEKETLKLQQQLQAKEEEKDTAVKMYELEISSLKDRLQSRPDDLTNEVCSEAHDEHKAVDIGNAVSLLNSDQSTQTDLQEYAAVEHSSPNHDLCKEQIQMLEQKIMDLEGNSQHSDFAESLQICEALVREKEAAIDELSILRDNFDSVVIENESLKQEILVMEKYIQEKNETNEFETLEKETQQEHEAQLTHEITRLKKLVENAELCNQELEGNPVQPKNSSMDYFQKDEPTTTSSVLLESLTWAELENKTNLLKAHEKQIGELKKEAEVLMKKARYSDLAESMQGDSEKLFEEVFQLKQSLGDAETVTRDSQREVAFLRSENLELKEKMDIVLLRSEQREKDAFAYEKQLEVEKSNYKKMQADLQKELQCAFNEINQLNGLMAGRVPKDLLCRVELEKKIADCSKQLANILEEKSALEKEVSYLSQYKSLPSEVEHLKDTMQKTSEELHLLQNEREHSAKLISDQNTRIQEQEDQIERLRLEVTHMQEKLQQAEQQVSELKLMIKDLQERWSLADEEIKKKDSKVHSLEEEIIELKHTLEMIEVKLFHAQEEKEELVQTQQDLATSVSNTQEMLKTTTAERNNLQEQMSHLSSLVETLQQQVNGQSELFNEKQQLEQSNLNLTAELLQLKETINNFQTSVDVAEESSEMNLKLEALQVDLDLLVLQRDELQSKLDDLTAENSTLKKDLHDNIEMSIETQDELRTSQEELKHQKQLVANLKQQISDYAKDVSKEIKSQENSSQAHEDKCEALIKEKLQLETSLMSEIEQLQKRVNVAEQAVAQLEQENKCLLQKLSEAEEELQSVGRYKEELECVQTEKDKLSDEIIGTKNQVSELNAQLQLADRQVLDGDVTGKLQAQIQEQESLLETLKAVTEERDQLKLDLQENIEISVETQEELRNALDELKTKSQLLETLRSQMNAAEGQSTLMENNLENKILHLEEQLLATVTERDRLAVEIQALSDEIRSLKDVHTDSRIQTQDQEVQVFQEMSVEELVNVKARLEQAETECNLLKENINHLQQQLLVVSQDKEESCCLINALQEQKSQLLASLQSCVENEATSSRIAEELANEIEKLKEQIINTNRLVKLKDQEVQEITEKLKEEMNGDNHVSEVKLLEESLQQSNTLLETLQREKLELAAKISTIQEELEKVVLCRDGLQGSLDNALGENATQKENIETLLKSCSTAQEELQSCQLELQRQIHLVNSLSLQEKEITSGVLSLDEKAFVLHETLLEKTTEHEQIHEDKIKHEEDLKCETEDLMKRVMETETILQCLQNEKRQTEEQLVELQQQLRLIVEERDDLKGAQERLIAEIDNLKRNLQENDEMMKPAVNSPKLADMELPVDQEHDQLLKNLEDMASQLTNVQNEKNLCEDKISNLQKHMEAVTQERDELQITLQSLTSERDQLKDDLRENVEMSIETQDDLRRAQEELQQQKTQASEFAKEISSLEQKVSSLQTELCETAAHLKEATYGGEAQDHDKLKQELEVEQLLQELEQKKASLSQAEIEKADALQTINELTQKLKATSEERDQINCSKLDVEREYGEAHNELKRTQKELHLQQERVENLTAEMSQYEQKFLALQKELQEGVTLLKEAIEEKEILNQAKQKLSSQIEQLSETLKDKEASLELMADVKGESSQKLLELSEELRNVSEERDQLYNISEALEKEFGESRDELKRTHEELDLQKERVENLTAEMCLCEQKCSSLQKELQENINLLKEASEEKEVLNQAKEKLLSQIEQLSETLASKEASLEMMAEEKGESAKQLLELSEAVKILSQEKDQLQKLKENLENAAFNLKEDLKQLQDQYEEFRVQERQKSRKLEELITELEQLKETIGLRESSAQKLEDDKAALQKKVQQCELEMASLHQEQEQFQQLLQRARSEKENIYTNLQDQEMANDQLKELLTACQTELETVKKQRDEKDDNLAKQINKVNETLSQLSSLQQQLQQAHEDLNHEKNTNSDLCEKVSHLEKEINILLLKESDPKEEDELAECTQILQGKNQEMKDLMVNISNVFDDQHATINNLSLELQVAIEAEKQSTSVIKESMSSTVSRELESLQTERIKLNSQLQTLLNKFKVIYRNTAVKEEQYSVVNDLECELCGVQKKNDELQLQCQSLEESGTKWSEKSAEKLKLYEHEYLNTLISQKTEVLKRVKDGFSEVQVNLNSIENNLKDEVNYKKQFLSWLEESKGSCMDAKKLNEGFHSENKRIAGFVRLLTNKLKEIVQSRIKKDTMAYIYKLDKDLQEKKEKNNQLVQKLQQLTPSGNSSILEEENAKLCDKLKDLQAELKKTQSRIKNLENEVTLVKAEAKQKQEIASRLQERLLSSVTEAELREMKVKISEKEKHLEAALMEMKVLQEKIAKGAAPYQEEIEDLKNQVVKVEMERMKLSKSTDNQLASLRSCIEYKEECLRKLKEQLRRSQKEADTTICPDKDESSYPLTCGGGSGIVQSTAMLLLQSENAALKREVLQYKKKLHHLSRSTSSKEDELKKLKNRSQETPSLFSSLHSPDTSTQSQSCTDQHRQTAASPSKSDKTGIQKKPVMSPCKPQLPRHKVVSPNKTVRQSIPAVSPGKSELERKRALSPYKPEGQLFSNLTLSPCKKKSILEYAGSHREKFFDERSKSLPYCPTKFFDNSTLGTLPDPVLPASDINPSADPNLLSHFKTSDLDSGHATDVSEGNWWDRSDKNKDANECKTS